LANNHINDYGLKGIDDTIKICKQNNLLTVGAGLNYNEENNLLYYQHNGIKIAIISFAENEFNTIDLEKGGSSYLDIIDIVGKIIEAKKQADHVIIFSHSGNEHYVYPSPNAQKR